MKKVVIIIVMFLIGVSNVNADTSYEKAKFVRCVDGDTAVFKISQEEVKFRFLAIDTPETVHPTKEVEAYGKNASEYTCNKLSEAKEIIVEYENSNKTDKYGRSLAWIWIDGSLLQKELVSVGYGEVAYIYGNYRYTESLCLAQKTAKESKLGLWVDGKEEGYCSTVDLTNVEDNINYDDIADDGELTEEEKKLFDTIDNITNVTDKISKFTDNSEKVTGIMYYIIVGVAVVTVVIKQLKK
ncbi:MAG: thermonuclease family protein [Bacilli bacterium]|nr:thermonuclease family protein [Bacilli bacterium]